jgi:hypothetical protein
MEQDKRTENDNERTNKKTKPNQTNQNQNIIVICLCQNFVKTRMEHKIDRKKPIEETIERKMLNNSISTVKYYFVADTLMG